MRKHNDVLAPHVYFHKKGLCSEKVKRVNYRLLEHFYVYEINLQYPFGISPLVAENPSSCCRSSLYHTAQAAVAKLKYTSPLPHSHSVNLLPARRKAIFTESFNKILYINVNVADS